MNSSNIQSRLAEDKDLFDIYDVLKSTKLNVVLDSSQMSSGLSLNRIRNYLFSYDVIFCISTNKKDEIEEIAAFELSPQMFTGNEVKLFYWGHSIEEPRISFILESFVLIKKLLGINYVNLVINRSPTDKGLLEKDSIFSNLKLIHLSEIKAKNMVTDNYYIDMS